MNSFSVIFIEFDLLVVFSGLVVSTELGISVIVSNIASKTLITLSLPKSDKLSKLEIKNYGKLFNIDFTEEDFNNYNNEDYLFTKIVVEPIKNLYHS